MRKIIVFCLIFASLVMTPWMIITLSTQAQVYRSIDEIPERKI
jgi:biopolymer transport protein ExbB/TolQ